MKVRILDFTIRYNGKKYKTGEVYTIDEDMYNEVEEFVKLVENDITDDDTTDLKDKKVVKYAKVKKYDKPETEDSDKVDEKPVENKAVDFTKMTDSEIRSHWIYKDMTKEDIVLELSKSASEFDPNDDKLVLFKLWKKIGG